ncbi:phosphoadenosine phosphosulfate reductase domain-containing protein [Halarcobacter anaerophilus]|uniref:Phosphoadenosine phosphosulphate reductase domain-containing protein n=1 Tax=Halarcobacter anaerophilus TaxID=877500 RepID=A0A4Q0XUR3_9BACT|nr:phosphoadenosine phosphosulfate reductase family protein [Halarcobacter anaerophilus]QDF30303.1 putative sulfurtransferase [Halarcobacter anaerophilus]RXJ61206.1 hypothetical protein CRV06_14420 [Halarcobacter anaerophilus]
MNKISNFIYDSAYQNVDLKTKIEDTKSILREYYINDSRPLCVAFSGGKDSTALVFLMISLLLELQKENKLEKTTHIVNSNTLAELPPLLEHLETSLKSIQTYANTKNLNIKVHEVVPEDKHTLNVQLLGVGMPPPSMNFRWCTTKLKVWPIEKKLKELFPDGKFISVVGSRRDESSDRKKRIIRQSKVNSHLKINDRFTNADNLYPIEFWNTKNIWEYILDQDSEIIDTNFLWSLYSDASSKNAHECSFVGAGGKHIDEGKIGCGQSRFGCWQCYVVRDNDKSLDGLLKSGYSDMDLYKDYRELYWNFSQKGWENTRDVYSHRTQQREFFEDKPERVGMTKPKGVMLKIRMRFFEELLKLNAKLSYEIITLNEIKLIQERWLYEGDLELKAFKLARKFGFDITHSMKKELLKNRRSALEFYNNYLNKKELRDIFAILTLKRFAIQHIINKEKITNKFFPTKDIEKHIRKEWKKLKTIKKDIKDYNIIDYLNK